MKEIIQLYVRRISKKEKCLVGIIDSATDLNAESFSSFLFGGFYDPQTQSCKIELSRDPIPFSAKSLDCGEYPSIDSALTSSGGWPKCDDAAEPNLFAGRLIAFRTLSSPGGNAYRYLIFSAIHCNGLSDHEGLMLLGDFGGLDNASTLTTMSSGEQFHGCTISQILQRPVWGADEPRGHYVTLELHIQEKLNAVTACIAKGDEVPPSLDTFYQAFRSSFKNKEYLSFLRNLYKKDPDFFSMERLSPKTNTEINARNQQIMDAF